MREYKYTDFITHEPYENPFTKDTDPIDRMNKYKSLRKEVRDMLKQEKRK